VISSIPVSGAELNVSAIYPNFYPLQKCCDILQGQATTHPSLGRWEPVGKEVTVRPPEERKKGEALS